MTSRLALESTQPSVQLIPGTVYLVVKWHSPPSRAEDRNSEDTPPFAHTSSWHGAQFTKPRDRFTEQLDLPSRFILESNAGISNSAAC
jgi:hypothetical protein